MSARYFFQNVSRFEHLEDFLRDRIQSVVDTFIPDGRYNLVTRIQSIRARSHDKKPEFLCEIRLDSPQNSSAIVVKKKGANFHKATIQVSNVLKKVLRRQSSLRAQHFRREHQLSCCG